MIFAIPTDTCFGFASSLYDEAGFHLIYDIKGREANKRLSMAVKNYANLKNIIEITSEQIKFLRNYPYPFTVLGPKSEHFRLPTFLDENDYGMIAVRVGEKCLTNEVLQSIEFPVFLTSANQSGESEIYSDKEIRDSFGNIEDLRIFKGSMPKCSPSDIFSFVGNTLELNYIRRNH